MSSAHAEGQMQDRNRRFYDALWSQARLVSPQRFNTWPLINALPLTAKRLEIAAGLRPRLPIGDTCFVDISPPALRALSGAGGRCVQGSVTALPLPDRSFDVVCALDVVEHVEDGDAALAELARVAADDATLLLSVPLYMACWTPFDEIVGHRRRYEPDALVQKLTALGFVVEGSAVFGMQPRKSWLLDLGMWFLKRHRRRAMWWYNRVFMPLGVRFQRPLTVNRGFVAAAGVDEVLLLCRKQAIALAA